MTHIDEPKRRKFLKMAAGSVGGLAAMSALPLSLRQAMAAPATRIAGDISDVQHVVIFMQENRSFDHYYGSLNGVRGFGDRVPPPLPGGKSVWHQPYLGKWEGYLLPFHINTKTTSGICINAPAMSYPVDMLVWSGGKHNGWNLAGDAGLVMGHFTRDDLPYYYALADAFTICDQYHCSTFTQTNPNRLHFFTGSNGLSVGQAAVLDNTEASDGFTWTTYAERLEHAGISWKVYQQSDNFDDNSLAWFKSFKQAKPGQPLYDKGMATVPDLVASFADDVNNDRLPQVSWIVGPSYLSEHANYKPAYGEDLSARLLAALAANPQVWAKTLFILNYDENGGFFDHLPPPTPPTDRNEGLSTVSTDGEIYQGDVILPFKLPIGLGFRVPLILVSPWTRGGWVCSQVFDHTSVLRFLETRFGVAEPNISAWRRAVCGDLTAAFDFSGSHPDWPHDLPVTTGYPAQADLECSTLPAPGVPATQAMPVQESGLRHARALPYELHANGHIDTAKGRYVIDFANTGSAAAVFQIYPGNRLDGPWRYTVEAGKSLSDYWTATLGFYDLEAHGPNGFLRQWRGTVILAPFIPMPELRTHYDTINSRLQLTLTNEGHVACTITVRNGYHEADVRIYSLAPGQSRNDYWDIAIDHHWYDLNITMAEMDGYWRRLAGHMENGLPSFSEPRTPHNAA